MTEKSPERLAFEAAVAEMKDSFGDSRYNQWDLDEGLGEVIAEEMVGTWRWGTEHFDVWKLPNGELAGVFFRTQPEHGIQGEADVMNVKVETKTRYVPA